MGLSILKLERNMEVQKAYKFFNILCSLSSNFMFAVPTKPFSGISPYGMVDVVQMFNKAAKFTAENDENLNAVMDSLTNILIGAVVRRATLNENKQVASQNWRDGFNAMAELFFTSYSVNEFTFRGEKTVKEIIDEVIDVAFDADGKPRGNLRTGIVTYFEKQGKLMNILVLREDRQSVPYTLIEFVNFVKNGKHICRLCAFFTEFNSDILKICDSGKDDEKKFDFNLKVTCCNADFMLDYWNTNERFRERINKFINGHMPRTPYFEDFVTTHRFTVV